MPAQTISRWVFSDQHRCPDWRAALALASGAGAHKVGLILRDYAHPERPQLARDMAAYCARERFTFAIAGDASLAAKYGAGFHCPSYLLPRAAARLGPARAQDLAAVHNQAQIHQAGEAGFGKVFLSPVFATQSHRGVQPLGPLRAHALARFARQKGLQVFALGGMSEAGLHRLDPQKTIFQGFGAIDAFAPNKPAAP
ncbi:MAG: thiamine phosphate synthase [Rhodobiaceae bacterium]|jgi:thiamine monophosphate synthase|nr:thiamine phosphate synthase [Rhodobiaceae bacterium]MBT5518637.1 thiamine phosphate synthase [Rhodobiaceae bacterium]MBT7279704.1 thiamine phosphate synthase [Rhodobiaceae bacterium]MDG2496314.1 thiamine phosphate synthase [Alphaproteobacteria bacterium]